MPPPALELGGAFPGRVHVARCFGGSIVKINAALFVGAYAREGGMGEFSSLLVLFVESSRHGDRLSVLHARQQPLGPRRQGQRLDARGAPATSIVAPGTAL